MHRLSTWLFITSFAIVAGVVSFVVLQPEQTFGDVESFEQALAAAAQSPVSGQPEGDVAQPQPPEIAPQAQVESSAAPEPATIPSYPVQDTSLESLERTSAQPIWIRIDSIDVASEINGYGINPRTGQMDVPNNVTEVGWYEYGPSPGEDGSAVLAAHVDLASRGPGVFYSLGDIEAGAIVVVGFDDGTSQRFQVQARTSYLKDELPLDSIFSRSGPSVLTLITCGGGFNASVSGYDSNVVAYAVPIGDPFAAG